MPSIEKEVMEGRSGVEWSGTEKEMVYRKKMIQGRERLLVNVFPQIELRGVGLELLLFGNHGKGTSEGNGVGNGRSLVGASSLENKDNAISLLEFKGLSSCHNGRLGSNID